MTRRKTKAELEAAIVETIGKGESAALQATLGRKPTPAETKAALAAALNGRQASIARIAAADVAERGRINAARLTPLGQRIEAINVANKKYAPGILANANKGAAARALVVKLAKELLAKNPRHSKSGAAKKIASNADAPCGERQVKAYLDDAFTADEWRKLADAVTDSAS